MCKYGLLYLVAFAIPVLRVQLRFVNCINKWKKKTVLQSVTWCLANCSSVVHRTLQALCSNLAAAICNLFVTDVCDAIFHHNIS